MKCFRTLFVVVLAAMTSKVAYCAQIWPCPGVCFTDGAYFPDLEKGWFFLTWDFRKQNGHLYMDLALRFGVVATRQWLALKSDSWRGWELMYMVRRWGLPTVQDEVQAFN